MPGAGTGSSAVTATSQALREGCAERGMLGRLDAGQRHRAHGGVVTGERTLHVEPQTREGLARPEGAGESTGSVARTARGYAACCRAAPTVETPLTPLDFLRRAR